jgi:hypothetical protein
MNFQIPKPKSQTNSNYQTQKQNVADSALKIEILKVAWRFGDWDFTIPGVWCLECGIFT